MLSGRASKRVSLVTLANALGLQELIGILCCSDSLRGVSEGLTRDSLGIRSALGESLGTPKDSIGITLRFLGVPEELIRPHVGTGASERHGCSVALLNAGPSRLG